MSWRTQIIYLVPVTRQHKAPVRLVLRGACQLLSLQCSPSVNIFFLIFFLEETLVKTISMVFTAILIVMSTWKKCFKQNIFKAMSERIFRRIYVCFSNAVICAVFTHVLKEMSCSWSGYSRTRSEWSEASHLKTNYRSLWKGKLSQEHSVKLNPYF